MNHWNEICILGFSPAHITCKTVGCVSGGRGVEGWLC